jgi:hypothetical protein
MEVQLLGVVIGKCSKWDDGSDFGEAQFYDFTPNDVGEKYKLPACPILWIDYVGGLLRVYETKDAEKHSMQFDCRKIMLNLIRS